MHYTVSVGVSKNELVKTHESTYPFGRVINTAVHLVPALCCLFGAVLALRPIIVLDIEKLLSIGTLSAEISFTFYGLLFAGYAFYSDTLNNLVCGDESYADIVLNMQIGYKNWLRALGFQCVLAVCCNVGVCILSSSALVSGFFYDVLINASYLMSIALMIECVVFVVRMVNPESTSRTASEMLESYAKENDSETTSGCTIERYLKRFNELEKFLLWRGDFDWAHAGGRMPTMFDAVRRLFEMGTINGDEAKALHEVRRYRNLLAHDNDAVLEPNQMTKLDEQYRYYTEQKFADAFVSYRKYLSAQQSTASE